MHGFAAAGEEMNELGDEAVADQLSRAVVTPYAAPMPDAARPGDAGSEEAGLDAPVETLAVDGAVRSLEGEAPWSVAWGKLPAGITSVRVTFLAGRRSEPAARVGVVGRHWAAEVAGRFDKVRVTAGETQATTKIRDREKPVSRGLRKRAVAEHADPLERMKQHWGLAAVILQPGSADRPEMPDIRSAAEH
jgi:hypothetical protein